MKKNSKSVGKIHKISEFLISKKIVELIIKKIYFNSLFSKAFHTQVYCLQNQLSDCESVLDLGCGPHSPLQYCKGIKYSVGVETFKPYLMQSKGKRIHTKYVNQKIGNVNFPKKSFDAVILIEVLEHLSEKQGREILKRAESWARKKIIISTPNGFLPQKEVDGNPFQKHLCGWNYKKVIKFGFSCRGLAGLKVLRQEVQNASMKDDLLTTIRFWPKPFWFVVAALSQIPTYFIPTLSFELFGVKKLK